MQNVFEKEINGITYTFYRIRMIGEVVYNISFIKNDETEVFIMRKKKGNWQITMQDTLAGFVYTSELNLHDTICQNENG